MFWRVKLEYYKKWNLHTCIPKNLKYEFWWKNKTFSIDEVFSLSKIEWIDGLLVFNNTNGTFKHLML